MTDTLEAREREYTEKPTKASRVTDKDAATKLARRRLSVLELAQELGNITRACKQAGMDRTSFYEWQKRFQEQGLDGLKDLPPIVKNHPFTTNQATQERVVALALENPTRGCNYLADLLAAEGIALSFVTVQNTLGKHGLGTRAERLLAVERQVIEQGLEVSPDLVKQLERANPIFKERHVQTSRPGELLCQDNVLIGSFKGIGKVYLHTIVDAFGSYAFGLLGTSKEPVWSASVLYNEALPFYAGQGIPVAAVLTDNGTEFCGKELQHPYELLLSLSEIEHRRTKVKTPRTNGFVERFHRTVLEEFFSGQLRKVLYTEVSALQSDFDAWLLFYNMERPHQGYRNMGRKPIETVRNYVAQQAQQPTERMAEKAEQMQDINP